MKKISTLVLGLSLMASSALYASSDHTGNHMHEGKMTNHEKEASMGSMNMDSMNHDNMSQKSMKKYHNMMKVDGYEVTLSSMKPLSDGKNHMSIMLKKDGKPIKNASVKIKFDMPMMPGMDISDNAKLKGDKYTSTIDFSMQGKWTYELDFITSDKKMHKAQGSVNF